MGDRLERWRQSLEPEDDFPSPDACELAFIEDVLPDESTTTQELNVFLFESQQIKLAGAYRALRRKQREGGKKEQTGAAEVYWKLWQEQFRQLVEDGTPLEKARKQIGEEIEKSGTWPPSYSKRTSETGRPDMRTLENRLKNPASST
jgi:hypothetical protein